MINENEFLEIDDDINKDIKVIEKEYRQKSVYILHYPNGDDIKVSYGLLKGIIDKKDIIHYCNTEKGSSGSPIISLKNNKVIGIHIGSPQKEKFQFNNGIFIKEVLKILYKDIKNENKINNKISNEKNKDIKGKLIYGKLNEIKLKIKIEEKDINNKIYFLDNTKGNYWINGKIEEHHHDDLKELNELNTEIFINKQKFKYEKYFEPKKIGIYHIIIKL